MQNTQITSHSSYQSPASGENGLPRATNTHVLKPKQGIAHRARTGEDNAHNHVRKRPGKTAIQVKSSRKISNLTEIVQKLSDFQPKKCRLKGTYTKRKTHLATLSPPGRLEIRPRDLDSALEGTSGCRVRGVASPESKNFNNITRVLILMRTQKPKRHFYWVLGD